MTKKSFISFVAVVFLLLVSASLACAESGVPGDDPDYVSDNVTVAPEDVNVGAYDYVPFRILNIWQGWTSNVAEPAHVCARVQSFGSGFNVTLYLLGNVPESGEKVSYYNSTRGKWVVKFFKEGRKIGEFRTASIEFVNRKNSRRMSEKPDCMTISQRGRVIAHQNIWKQDADIEITEILRPTESTAGFKMRVDRTSQDALLYARTYTFVGGEKELYSEPYIFQPLQSDCFGPWCDRDCAVSPIFANFPRSGGSLEVYDATTDRLIASKEFRSGKNIPNEESGRE